MMIHIFAAKVGMLMYTLRPEGLEIIQSQPQGADLCFKNQNSTRNPKICSKQSIVDPTQYYFFQKTVTNPSFPPNN